MPISSANQEFWCWTDEQNSEGNKVGGSLPVSALLDAQQNVEV